MFYLLICTGHFTNHLLFQPSYKLLYSLRNADAAHVSKHAHIIDSAPFYCFAMPEITVATGGSYTCVYYNSRAQHCRFLKSFS